ncbi:MAG: N-acetylmuramoyl-L-alanine amidase [Saprospiraceae bacterium]|jgi:N-acetylmuramoyl-L-alanine amidase|nr:N-acetylmuramoyl-L-alanine amidase [Saprospiraceae bacterium]
MLAKIIQAIKSFFNALFGSKPQNEPTTAKPPKTKPEPIDLAPQDGSEITPDTIVVVANEMDFPKAQPGDNAPDKDFDDDIFVEEQKEEIPAPPPPAPTETPKPEIPTPTPTTHQRYLWCLDNGHGKKTKGKRSPLFDDGTTQFLEYEFNRDIVSRITKALDNKDIAYFIVVPEEDIDDFLEGRVNRANSKKSTLPKLFVSVHSNAAPAASANSWAPDNVSGIETWFYHGSKRGQKMAGIFQKYLLEKTGLKNRHIKSKPDGQFYVLRKTAMTSVLTENGFYNNKKEAAALMDDKMRQKIADAHVAAIMEIEDNGL